MEDDFSALGLQSLHNHSGTGQRCVPAKWHLDSGRKPAEPIVPAIGHQEGRFGEVILRGDRLQGSILRETIQGHYGRRVPCKTAGGEGVDLKYWRLHRDI